MKSRYELFDHTADIGVRVWAPTLSELVVPAGQALYAVIGELIPAESAETHRLSFGDDEPALLLRDYLAELLRLFETQRRMVTAVEVEQFSADRLRLAVQLHPVDESRSAYEREVKAVTYHELNIRPVPGGHEATYILDI